MPIQIDEVTANVPAEQAGQAVAAPGQGDNPPGPAAQMDELRRRLRKLEQRRARVRAD